MVEKIPFKETGRETVHTTGAGRRALRRAGANFAIKARRRVGGKGPDGKVRRGSPWETVGYEETKPEAKKAAASFLRNCSGYQEAFVENSGTGRKVRGSLVRQEFGGAT